MAELAVKGHSLGHAIERGRPVLGSLYMTTTHGHIYSCTSPRWVGCYQEALIKVIIKSVAGETIWNQTMIDCLHARYEIQVSNVVVILEVVYHKKHCLLQRAFLPH